MKPEDQITEIAAVMGWHPDPVWESVRTATHCVFKKGDELRTTKELPDWLNDLNAAHEMEKTLSQIQCFTYRDTIQSLILKEEAKCSEDFVFGATANQRAECFLKTLCKWRDE
jgi:hypothetical protein